MFRHLWYGAAAVCVALLIALPAAAQEETPAAEEMPAQEETPAQQETPAQEETPAQDAAMTADEQAMMEKWAEFATPGEPHQRLASQEGEWEWTSKWWQAPGAPAEETSGTLTATMAMDGRYLIEDYEGTMMGQPFRGHSITGYDNFREEYFSIWIDNMGTGLLVSRGEYDPEQEALVMSGTYDDIMTGERDKPMRGVSKRLDENTLHYEMFVSAPGGEEFKTLEIHATRAQ